MHMYEGSCNFDKTTFFCLYVIGTVPQPAFIDDAIDR